MREDGELLRAEQLARLKKSLQDNHDAGKRNHVIMFVHGWRHDADLDNANVRTFRTLLNYSSSFAQQRDDNAIVTGVYVGWRGRLLRERTTRSPIEDVLGTAFVLPTFWSRKRASEEKKVVQRLFAMMEIISGTLNRPSSANAAPGDSFMVVGHSFGGNMIATAVKEPIRKALKQHTPGDEFVLPFADLIVLINPAAEASKMNDLQRRIRERARVHEDKPYRDLSEDEKQRFETLFPITQPPRYISLTSTKGWSESEIREGDRPAYDWATGFAFPIGQFLAGKSGEDRQAIGHNIADYRLHDVTKREKEDNLTRLGNRGPAVGASHDMITIDGLGIETNFSNAEEPGLSACSTEMPWLYDARQRKKISENNHGRSWDTHRPEPLLTWTSGEKQIEVQFRQQLSVPPSLRDRAKAAKDGVFRFDRTVHSVAPANSPIWITRAYDNVITNHGGFRNYPMWCVLSQILMDDVARTPE